MSVKFGKILLKIDLNNNKKSVDTELKVKKRNCDLFSNKKVLFSRIPVMEQKQY